MQALCGDGETVYAQEDAEHHKRLEVHAVFCGENRVLRRHEEGYEVNEALKICEILAQTRISEATSVTESLISFVCSVLMPT